MPKHEVTKVRRDTVRRTLSVAAKQHLTPQMLRIVFRSNDLDGFDSPSPDDHIKLFISGPDGEIARRDFTPRAWDLAAKTFTIDFALHESGAACDWARAAQEGDTLEIGGPRGSTVVPDDFAWYVLIGDASALPSFSRRLETLRPGVPVEAFVLIAGTAEEQSFNTRTQYRVHWLLTQHNAAQDALILRAALETFDPPAGDGFIWIAAEKEVSRLVYQYWLSDRKHPAEWMKAAAYWSEAPE